MDGLGLIYLMLFTSLNIAIMLKYYKIGGIFTSLLSLLAIPGWILSYSDVVSNNVHHIMHNKFWVTGIILMTLILIIPMLIVLRNKFIHYNLINIFNYLQGRSKNNIINEITSINYVKPNRKEKKINKKNTLTKLKTRKNTENGTNIFWNN